MKQSGINVLPTLCNVVSTLCNVVSTLFQRQALTLYQRCATLKIRRWILFHFQRQINVISTLRINVETTLIQRWNVGWVRRLKLVEFFYAPVRHCRNVSNRSVLSTYKLRRCDAVSAWSRTLKLVAKMGQFILGTKAVHFSNYKKLLFTVIKKHLFTHKISLVLPFSLLHF